MKGLYQITRDSGNEFIFQTGILGNLAIRKTFSELIGGKWTEKDEQEYQKLLKDEEYRAKVEKEAFIKRYGQEVLDMHNSLNERLNSNNSASSNVKQWKLSSWEDEYENNEYFYLVWDRGNYSIVFMDEDGTRKTTVKDNISNEYLEKCLNNWQ